MWSEALSDPLIELKVAVDVAKQEETVLTPERLAAFKEQYRKILEAGEETKTHGVSEEQGKHGRKKQPKAKNLLGRCHKYLEEILAFIKDFTIPFTNNQAERDLHMMKLKQKIFSGTFRSEEGTMNFCRVGGFISTVKKHRRPVLSELRRAFEGTPFIPTAVHRVL